MKIHRLIAVRKPLFFFLIAFLSTASSFAQRSIRGEVVDSLTLEPLPFVNVIEKGTQNGTLTDIDGKFNISIEEGSELVFSSLGHVAKTITPKENFIQVQLRTLVRELPEAVVDDDPYETVFEDPMQTVLDFDFYDDKIILLIRSFRRREGKRLEIMTENGVTVSSVKVSKRAEEIDTDCLDYVHVLTPDSAFQVYYDYEKIQLIHPETRQRYHLSMDRCECALGKDLFFRFPTYRGLKMKYLVARDGDMQEFFMLEDSLKMEYIRRRFDLNYYLAKRKQGDARYGMPVDDMKRNLDNFRLMEEWDWQDSKILEEVFAPALSYKNRLTISDYANGRFLKFDKDLNLIRTVPFDYHLQPGWDKRIIKDEADDTFYTVFIKDGETTLCSLDPETMEIKTRDLLPDKGQLRELKVRNGVAWFLDKDFDADGIYSLFNFVLEDPNSP